MSRKKSLLIYTVLYGLLAAAVWGWFLYAGKSFICDADAYEQHINALMLYGRWLRACPGALLSSLKSGMGFALPNYSFGIGYGADLYTSLQYYCVGDPLNLPLAFIPTKYVYLYYHFLILLRPYLAGLAFIAMTAYLGSRDHANSSEESVHPVSGSEETGKGRADGITAGTVTGALLYAFSGTVLFIGMWNPFFTAPMILLPLLVLGAVRIIDGKSPLPFILSVFLSGITNFYFFYMLVLLIIGYVIIFILTDRRDGRRISLPEAAKLILRFLGYGIAGTLMSMAVLLPVALAFVSNPRAGLLEHGVLPLYEPAYYKELLVNLTAYIYHPLYDTELCLTFIAVPAVAFLFLHFRRNRRVCILLLVSLVMLLFPAAGYVMGGFSYMINRWCFAAGLVIAFAAKQFIDGAAALSGKEKAICAAASAVYAVLVLLTGGTGSKAVLLQLLLLAAVCVLLFLLRGRRAGIVIAAFALCGIVGNGYMANAPSQGDLPGGFVEAAGADAFYEQYMSNEVLALEQVTGVGDSDFIRYTGRNLIWNSPLLKGISSTQFYWSLANGAVARYLSEMAVNEMADYSYFGLDDRVSLLALSGTDHYTLRYQTPEEAAYVPAGFTKAGDYYNFGVFRNSVPLGAGYVAAAMIPEEEYRAMTPAMRQEALMQGVVTAGDAAEGLPEAEPVYTHTVCAVQTEPGEGVTDTGHSFAVTSEGAKCRILFEGEPQSETMLYVKGLHYDGDITAMNIQVRDCSEDTADASAGVMKYIAYKTPRSQFYSGWHDYLVNLCYHEAPRSAMEITFPAAGTYRYEDISVVCQPIVPYFEHLVSLAQGRELSLDLHKDPVSHTTSLVTGEVTAAADGFLVLNIPWQDGWTCRLDGGRVPLLQADTMFMGTNITAGTHTFELRYRTPGLAAGMLLSAAGIALCLCISLQSRRRKRDLPVG